jgi:crotonobetainyl-CoA:carnitine CoA-transferase CaiB-like acyl-CoA transferase
VTDVLKGVRVIELSTVITAPLTGMMLADLGADVIKVEHPQGGDPFRNFRGGQYSPNFVAYNRGKRSIQLDLRAQAGRSILLKLAARADVLLENYRPGIMAKLGLGDDVLKAANARLIHCSITGFGASGPYSARPAYDNVAVTFRCSDGKLLAVHLSSQPKFFEAIVAALERPDLLQDERFTTRDLRIKNYGELNRVFADIVATKPRIHWMNAFEANDVPFAPVQSLQDVLDDPQVRYLRTFYQQLHPTEGEITAIHRPVLIDGARNERALPAPTLGEHTGAVLAELGYDEDEIAKLRAASVI